MTDYTLRSNELILDEDKHVLTIMLNAPERKNAFSLDMIEDLISVLNKADRDPNFRVILITGGGDCFCAGGDIKAMENQTGMFKGPPNELRERYQDGIQQIPLIMDSLKTPTIGVINGAAIGAGCDFAAMCDIRIGCEESRFGETFSRLGLVPGDGGTYFLPRVVGHAKAMEMFLMGKIYDAQEALNMGLLNYLTTKDELIKVSHKWASDIAKNAPIANQMIKKALKQNHADHLPRVLDLLAAFQGITQRTRDHEEALLAYKEKRTPIFEGE